MKKIAMIAWNSITILAILHCAITAVLAAYQLFWDILELFNNRKQTS